MVAAIDQITLYLGNIPSNASGADVRSLLSKVFNVMDIYIPPATATGIIRNFAMIRVHNTDGIHRYINALNNSLWKGQKIRLEMAKEYFIDKLRRERNEQNTTSTPNESSIENKHPLLPLETFPVFQSDTIKLCMSKFANRTITLTTVPETVNRLARPTSSARDRAQRIIFDEDGAVIKTNKLDSTPEGVSNVPHELTVQPELSSISKGIRATKDYKGGGLRRGFGTLASAPIVSNTINNALNHLNPSVPSSTSFLLKQPPSNEKVDPILLPDELKEAEEEVPCISAEELHDAALANERARYSSLLSQVLSEVKPNVQPIPRATNKVNNLERSKAFKSDQVLQVDSQAGGEMNLSQSQTHSTPFVDLTALKDIYHKEGGMWWGQDDKLKGAIGKGEDAQDEIFREAEKLGIDIRTNGSVTNINNHVEGSSIFSGSDAIHGVNDGGNFDAPKSNSKSMSFSFFDFQETDPPPFNGSNSGSGLRDHCGSNSSAELLKDSGAWNDLPIQTIEDIVKLAKKFTRGSTVEELTELWRQTRDKMTVDYKRKRREARKKQSQLEATQSKSHQSRASTTGQTSHDNQGRGDKKRRYQGNVLRRTENKLVKL